MRRAPRGCPRRILLFSLCASLSIAMFPGRAPALLGMCGAAEPCACGDQVVASRTLVPGVDPVATEVCPHGALVISFADSLTLDLGGATIRGSGTGFGIDISQSTNVAVTNGGI